MIKIDVDTRKFEIPWEEKLLGVESDEKVKKLKFEVSKNEYFSGLNFTDSACYINYKNGNVVGQYGITDVIESDGKVTFTWEVSREATRYKGKTYAILCAKKVREDGTIIREWNSAMGQFNVYEGIEPSSAIIEEPEIDIVSQLLSLAQQANSNALTNIEKSEKNIAKSEELIQLAQSLVNEQTYYQGVIVDGEAYSGEASNSGIKLHKVVGKTLQDGEPSPDKEVPIQNVKISNITSHGRQLFDASKLPTKSQGGATVTNNGDGSFTINGSGKLSKEFVIVATYPITVKAGLLKLDSINKSCPYTYVDFYDDQGNFITKISNESSSKSQISVSEEQASKIKKVLINILGRANEEIVSATFKPMLYQDGDGTWEQFKHTTVETSLTLAEGEVYEEGKPILRKRKKVVFDGSSDESWSVQNSANPYFSITVDNIKLNIDNDSLTGAFCNRLKEATPNQIWDAYLINCFSVDSVFAWNYIRIRIEGISTVEDFKAWLQSHPLEVEYKLAEPYEESIKVPTIPSYYHNTNIWTDNTVPTDIQWKLLADSDRSLEVEEIQARLAVLEGKQ